jgi:hypothetical protein
VEWLSDFYAYVIECLPVFIEGCTTSHRGLGPEPFLTSFACLGQYGALVRSGHRHEALLCTSFQGPEIDLLAAGALPFCLGTKRKYCQGAAWTGLPPPSPPFQDAELYLTPDAGSPSQQECACIMSRKGSAKNSSCTCPADKKSSTTRTEDKDV